ncbi:MAG: glycine--tRNA ligase [Firmicutes bacterium]|uniref:Glycine--tRNA ligase n=1 Tax=Candidatus Alloenteromonas pullistercoris TaxID=2840785 RepID=A0A9D9GW96_9FIRM|nr:glycine--tRNA ligase [Candidatus Enteromonas pullistercoris]
MANKHSFERIVTHLLDTGYVFQGSAIYGGLSNTWDYGPLGVELKNNIRAYWWQKFVRESPTNVGIDAAILMNPKVWEATGHVSTFNDPMVDCKSCKARHRADELIKGEYPDADVDGMTFEQMDEFIKTHKIVCPVCGKDDFTPIRKFNMMFKTHIGVTDDASSTVYLRPETAQGVFVNFRNVQRAMRRKLPFGICSAGKSFRNEITPGNFIFRTREFEQLEMEFFCKPGTDLEWFAYWKDYCRDFVHSLGVKLENLRFRDHEPAELAFYSKATTDVEYDFPSIGWGEILGVADRTDYDLKRHMEYSKQDLTYFDQDDNSHYVPYTIEPSMGLDRLLLMVVMDAYDEEALEGGDTRIVMHIAPNLAPYKAAILPLSKKLGQKALEVMKTVSSRFSVTYDETGSIGKRYRRQDEIGTPYCVTVDFDTENDGKVTVRDRDTMTQVRIGIDELGQYLAEKTTK